MPPRKQTALDDDFDETALFGSQPLEPMMPPKVEPRMRPEAPKPEAPPRNPLAKYYRKPGLHVHLPTKGAFLPRGAVTFSPTGDLPVWPMRASDEILLKSPDALMSGYAIEKLLESCVPDISMPRMVSQPDLDVLLLAIRAATYGSKMPIHANCPECGTENQFEIDLGAMLQTMTEVPTENPVRLADDIVAYVRPFDVSHAARMALVSFEETRKMQALEALGEKVSAEERSRSMGAAMDRLAKERFAITGNCVIGIVTPEGQVTDQALIMEFLQNVSRAWVKRIEEKQTEINDLGLDKKIACGCEKCGHNWSTDLEFNPSTFFA